MMSLKNIYLLIYYIYDSNKKINQIMDSLKEKISSTMKCIQNTIISNYKIIEQQEKICYFSKFTIDIDEFYTIYLFVHQIKKNVFNLMYDILKICISNYITFINDNGNNLSENQKMIIIYSACLKHYYVKYTFDINNTFEDFCSSDFNLILNEFNIKVINEEQFKIFLFYFYSTIQREIKKLNYERIKNLKKYYNPYIIQKNENNIKNKQCEWYSLKNISTFLAGTKARIIDMVFELQLKNKVYNDKKEIEFVNDSIKKIRQMSREFIKSQTLNKDFIVKIDNLTDEINNNNNNNINININNNNNNKNNNNNNNNENIPSYYSKRVLSEVIKLDLDKETEKKVILISKKLEEDYLDKILNSKYKMIKVLDHFICYIVEFNSKMIKSIFKNQILDDVNIRFIVPSKEIFNMTFELFIVLSNLPYTNLQTFLNISLKHGLQAKYCLTLYEFYKEFLQCLFIEKGIFQDVIKDALKKFYEKQLSVWEKQIQQKGKNLTSFYEI